MDIKRAARYKDKMDFARMRSEQIHEWALRNPEGFRCDEKTRLATYKGFQEMIEAYLDVIAMACKDSGSIPKDDYSNIERSKMLDEETKDALVRANGLRNRIIHHYNHTDDIIAYRSMRDLFPALQRFPEEVDRWIMTQLEKE